METTQLSSKGQIVIPQGIRERLEIKEGTLFVVDEWNDMIILKKVGLPSRQSILDDLARMARKSQKRLEAQGLTEEDIPKIVRESRRRSIKTHHAP